MDLTDYHDRFSGIGRLYGAAALDKLRLAHVAVVGIGGVGSWAVEAIARSGVGRITLIDRDDICVTNVNRQLHALDGQIGRSKAAVMAERALAIQPGCEITVRETFFTAANADELLAPGFDAVIDAIDTVDHKALLLAKCRAAGTYVVTCGGAGGKRDPSTIRLDDLAQATNDRLLKQVRKILRAEHGFPREEKAAFGIRAVYSTENALYPWASGEMCEAPEPGSSLRLNCDSGFGTATFVTGAFGFAAAGAAVSYLAARGS